MRTTLLTAAALLALTPAAFAATETYTADLKGASEVPAVDSKGSGALTATYDTASKKLTYTVSYKDLSGPATMAHFHGPADAKANAGVAVPVKDMAPATLKGEATLTDAQAADLRAGKWYFNIHTEKNKGGEIRGQVTKK
ncbi:MAG: CHRD domain-containing protein [Reyranella sp.]|uniref:CHRD domain-containing protein n=1 Tax=Reyranella sp. TaxID=1929291 RepID=UPI001AC6A833|nr:CHRD domain-containing protein [Reyranella sp.]MBN9086081.1 CHRD domain-containing protein [Reyranella sp.]